MLKRGGGKTGKVGGLYESQHEFPMTAAFSLFLLSFNFVACSAKRVLVIH